MVCLGVEPGVAAWKSQTNPLSFIHLPFVGIYFLSDTYLILFQSHTYTLPLHVPNVSIIHLLHRYTSKLFTYAQCDQLGDFLHFGQPFKAGGNNYFTQIAHIVRQFL